MIKKKFKIAFTLLAILSILITTFSFASDVNLTNTTEQENETTTENTTDVPQQEITNDDLYLGGNKIIMDEAVDGNVYIIANDVTITGKVNGNLYVMANTVKFQSLSEDNSCYVIGAAYVCANQVSFDAACTDLYATCNNFTGSYNSYIDRDVRISASDIVFQGLVGRNAFFSSNQLSLTSEEGISALIHGNLNYASKSELTIDNSIVKGEVYFTPITDLSTDITSTVEVIKNYAFNIATSLLFTIAIYLLLLWLTPKFVETSSKYTSLKMFLALPIGLVSFIIIPIISIIFLLTIIGIPLSFLLLIIYALLIMTSFAIVTISITQFLKSKLKSKHIGTDLLILIGVNIILWALQQIPYVGGWISFIILLMGLGIITMYLFTKNKKENTSHIVETNTSNQE